MGNAPVGSSQDMDRDLAESETAARLDLAPRLRLLVVSAGWPGSPESESVGTSDSELICRLRDPSLRIWSEAPPDRAVPISKRYERNSSMFLLVCLDT